MPDMRSARCQCSHPDHRVLGVIPHRDINTETVTWCCETCRAGWTEEVHPRSDSYEPDPEPVEAPGATPGRIKYRLVEIQAHKTSWDQHIVHRWDAVTVDRKHTFTYGALLRGEAQDGMLRWIAEQGCVPELVPAEPASFVEDGDDA